MAVQPPPQQSNGPDVADLVILDIEDRKRLGVSRYGVPLRPNNGRDALRDLSDELLDGLCYLKQLEVEREELLTKALDLAVLIVRLEGTVPAELVAAIEALVKPIVRSAVPGISSKD